MNYKRLEKRYRNLVVHFSNNSELSKHKVKFTAPAMLDGYLKLLSTHELLQQVTPDEIAQMLKQFVNTYALLGAVEH
ncbi:MAG: hypothetical protein KGV51_04880 [Moraxellaceae bacterium]|nr:hypothetical protein [Moraxellaceae bacterium]